MTNDIYRVFSLMERVDPQYKRYRQLVTEADSRLKMVDRIIDQVFSNYFNPDSTVRSSEYYVNDNPNTTWRQYLLFNLRHTFGLMQNSDIKYLPTVARLAYSNDVRFDLTNDNGEQVRALQRIVQQLKKDDNLFQKVKADPSVTFTQLYDMFRDAFDREDAADAEAANSVENTGSDYTVKEIHDFETAKYYGDRSCSTSKLCYTQNENTWNSYTKNGRNRAYVCLMDGWENIPEEPTEGNPYDLYGTSMIFVFVNPSGNITTSNCRWNHSNDGPYLHGVDQAFDKKTLSQTIGIPFDSVFKGKEISVDDIIEMIEDGDNESLQEIAVDNFAIPDRVRKIGYGAFEECQNLTSITIPDSVTEIGPCAFRNCESLTSITIPDSVTDIWASAFCNCKSLTSITMSNSVTDIGTCAFKHCVSLTSITIPDSVKYIESCAFSWCESLTSITIPNSVTAIGTCAFSNCTSLTVYADSEDTAMLVRNSGFKGNIVVQRK